MAIIGLAGQIGSGKSHAQLSIAIEYAEERRKQIVTNFPVNRQELIKYCAMPREAHTFFGNIQLWWGELSWELSKVGKILCHYLFNKPLEYRYKRTWKPRYPYLLSLLQKGMGVIEIVNPERLETLMIPESVICLDEAGVFLNARDFSKTSKKLLADLAQSRKDGCDLIWAAQFDGQVDRQFRQLTQYWWHCMGFTVYNRRMRRPELVWKERHYFMADDYDMWVNNPRMRADMFKTRFVYATRTVTGLLSRADRQLFNCFDSFSRLDLQGHSAKVQISTTQQCILPKTYYSNCSQVLAEEDYLRKLRMAYREWGEQLRVEEYYMQWVRDTRWGFSLLVSLAVMYWIQKGQGLYITARQDALDQWLRSTQYLITHHTVHLYCWGSKRKKTTGGKHSPSRTGAYTHSRDNSLTGIKHPRTQSESAPQEPKKPFIPPSFKSKIDEVQDEAIFNEAGGLADEMRYIQNGRVNRDEDLYSTAENLANILSMPTTDERN